MSSNSFSKMIRFRNRMNLIKNENVRFCIRPDCENYIIANPNNLHLKCLCGMDFCSRCNNKWHQGKTCEEVKEN